MGLTVFMIECKYMATKVYKTKTITLLNGEEIEILPLKIKYLREVMDIFSLESKVSNDDDSISILTKCAQVSMKQYNKNLATSIDLIEENFVLSDLYDILEFGAGIKIKNTNEENKKNTKNDEKESSWENLDLAKLEAEVFLLGIWKDYNELEMSLSMPELLITIENKRDLDYSEKKFLAAIQGVDLEEEEGRGQKEWEDMKAKVFSGGAAKDSNDILALQGANAQKNGFGIGMGLDYDDNRDPALML